MTDGGDFLAPGEYALYDLDLQPGGMATFYAEVVRPSTAVADLPITFEVDPTGSDGYVVSDRVRLTASRIQIDGTNYDGTAVDDTDRLVISDLSADPQSTSSRGYTPGAFQSYQIKVFDPRTSGLSQFFVNGQGLSMQRVGDHYETVPFLAVAPASPQAWQPGLAQLTLAAGGAELRYNPSVTVPSNVGPNSPQHLQDLAWAIEQSIRDMESANWTGAPNHDGGFGEAVHARASVKLTQLDPRWVADVYVGPDKTILSVGGPPAQAIPLGSTQVDLLYMKQGQNLAIGQVFDPAKIEPLGLAEIKTSIGGRIRANQLARLKGLVGGQDIVVTKGTLRQWSPGEGWHPNSKFVRMLRVLSIIGVATTALALVDSSQYDDQLQALHDRMDYIRNRPYHDRANGAEEKRLDMIDLQVQLSDYMKHFVPDPTVLEIIKLGMVYKIMDISV